MNGTWVTTMVGKWDGSTMGQHALDSGRQSLITILQSYDFTKLSPNFPTSALFYEERP